MSDTQLAAHEAALTLPTRTWRQWWRDLPGYWRIAGWSAMGLAVLHLALAVRIVVGLQEDAEIVRLKDQGIWMTYWWYDQPELFPGCRILIGGMMGCSGANIDAMGQMQYRDSQIWYDQDLKNLAAHFPNITSLSILRADVTSEGVSALTRCRRLERLQLGGADLDDEAVLELAKFDRLTELSIGGPRVTDASVKPLQRMRNLRSLDIMTTNLSAEAMISLRNQLTANGVRFQPDSADFNYAIAWIRWADGHQSRFFPGPCEIDKKDLVPPADSNPEPVKSSHFDSQFLFRSYFQGQQHDGDYEFRLKIADYESEPLNFQLRSATAGPYRLEFRMPCTQAEAMHAIRK